MSLLRHGRELGRFCRLSAIRKPSCNHFVKRTVIHGPEKPNEYTDVAEYPKIETFKSEDEKEFQSLADQMKRLKTVEEKQWYLNKPKYYGWYSCVIKGAKLKPDSQEFVQFATNTVVMDNQLPEVYKSLEELAENEAQRLQPLVKKLIVRLEKQYQTTFEVEPDTIAFQERHHQSHLAHRPTREKIQRNVYQLHRLILSHLATRHSHLKDVMTSEDARVEAFWFRAGYHPDPKMVAKRKGVLKKQQEKKYPPEWTYGGGDEDAVEKKYDRALQYLGSNLVQLKSTSGLPAYPEVPNDQIPELPNWNYSVQQSG